jgi:hypothetical protein
MDRPPCAVAASSERVARREAADLWDLRALCRIGVIDAAAGRAVPAIRSYESARKDYPLETALPAVE